MDVSMDQIHRIRNGDLDAYEAFVKQAWSSAVRACWIVLGEQRDAEEAAQDAFVKLFEKRDQLRDDHKFRSWFYRILMNSAKQIQRRRRPPSLLFQEVDIQTADNLRNVDLRISIQAAMQRLSHQERKALVLRYFADLTDRESANAAGWHLGTFKWRLSKAKRHMEKILASEDYLDMMQGGQL